MRSKLGLPCAQCQIMAEEDAKIFQILDKIAAPCDICGEQMSWDRPDDVTCHPTPNDCEIARVRAVMDL